MDELTFRKSSYSERNNCVEVADTTESSAVRDTQHRDHGHLAFPSTEWCALLSTARTDR